MLYSDDEAEEVYNLGRSAVVVYSYMEAAAQAAALNCWRQRPQLHLHHRVLVDIKEPQRKPSRCFADEDVNCR